jgi:protein-serine/threonine kinase
MADFNNIRRVTPTDDEVDQIGYDSPRSGIATPQPDLKDKRLPGIMSYFGQVRSTHSASPFSYFCPSTQARDTETPCSTSPQEEKETEKETEKSSTLDIEADKGGEPVDFPLLPHERVEPPERVQPLQQAASFFNPYPTPPCSKTPSEKGQKLSNASADLGREASICSPGRPSMSIPVKNTSDLLTHKIRRATLASPVTSIITTNSVSMACIPNPSGCVTASTPPSSPLDTEISSVDHVTPLSDERATINRLRKLTLPTSTKSGPPTPTRALSAAQPSPAEDRSASQTSRNGTQSNGRQSTSTSRSSGVQAPTQRGKLTIKIREGRGLRKSRDPYVVAVFQRSELISPGPRTFEDEDDMPAPTSSSHMGGIPISRQGSDSGRPMAIPMRSRQSSNTSISDYTTFRNRTRRSFMSPKWDAEAVLYVFFSIKLIVL